MFNIFPEIREYTPSKKKSIGNWKKKIRQFGNKKLTWKTNLKWLEKPESSAKNKIKTALNQYNYPSRLLQRLRNWWHKERWKLVWVKLKQGWSVEDVFIPRCHISFYVIGWVSWLTFQKKSKGLVSSETKTEGFLTSGLDIGEHRDTTLKTGIKYTCILDTDTSIPRKAFFTHVAKTMATRPLPSG